jgi:hypothetical protein
MSEEPPKSDSLASRKDLDDYIADPFNQNLLQDFNEFEWTIQVIDFFEWFYELVALIEKCKPSAVLQNLDAHKLDGPLRLWVVYHLQNRFRDSMRAAWPDATPEALPAAFQVIDAEYERLEKLYPPDMFPSYEGIHATASSAVARGKMVTDLLVNMLQKMVTEADEKRVRELEIRQDERERITREQIRVGREVLKAAKAQARNPEFTINRQVIAVCYLLKSLGVTANNSEKARFIEFLTDKNQKEIYKRVLAIDDTVYNLEGKDALYVRDWFLKLGLTELAKEIDDVLGRPHEKL